MALFVIEANADGVTQDIGSVMRAAFVDAEVVGQRGALRFGAHVGGFHGMAAIVLDLRIDQVTTQAQGAAT